MAIAPRLILSIALPLAFGNASAADWKITPRVDASETYTDNLMLTSNNQLSDFISQVTPGINIVETGNRTHATLDYDLEGLFYKNQSQLDHYYSQLNASGNAELVDKLLYIDAGASIVQQPLSLASPYGGNIGNATGNIVNVRTSSVSPYLLHRFGSIATGMARYTHMNQDYSSGGPSTTGSAYLGGLSSSTSDSTLLTLNSGTAFNNLLWGLNFNDNVIRYAGIPENRIAEYAADVGYLFTPKFKITVTGGYDDNNYVYFGPKPQNAFWSTEAAWAPTTHTKLSASTGHRYFGSTKSFMLSHFTRLTTLQASYSQNVTSSMLPEYISPATTLDQLLQIQIPDNAARQQAVQSLLSSLGSQAAIFGQNIITNHVYLDKAFNASLGINLPKSIIVLTVFDSKISSLEQGNSFLPGALNYGNVNQQGGTATWNWRLTPELSANASASLTNMTFPGQTLDENMGQLYLGLTKKLGKHLNSSLTYRHQSFTSNSTFNYMENAVIVGLNYFR